MQPGKFFLITVHCAENVDSEKRLRNVVAALEALYREYGYSVVVSLHPRTKSKIERFGVPLDSAGVCYLSFFDFIRLEQSAFCVLSDSGTVQEEACIFGVPNVTIRDVTERPRNAGLRIQYP